MDHVPVFELIVATPETVIALIARTPIEGLTVPDEFPETQAAREGLPLHLAGMQADPREVLWRIRLVTIDKRVIGSINMKGPPEDGVFEIGWGILSGFRGRGLATLATRKVLAWAFANGGRRAIARIERDNAASIAVARRLGMQLTNELRGGLPVWELVACDRPS